jgi:hypothetical protein
VELRDSNNTSNVRKTVIIRNYNVIYDKTEGTEDENILEKVYYKA